MSDISAGIVLLVSIIMFFVFCALSNKFWNDCDFLLSDICAIMAVLLLTLIPLFIYLFIYLV